VLQRITEKLSGAVREYDHVGRFGGDEFLVVLPDCTSDAAREVAERVRQHIGSTPVSIGPLQVVITASIGVTQWCANQESSDLVYRADIAMYRAKQNGHNRVEIDIPSGAAPA
jgi:diguanylate cyclase (GGDEF)-like protein